MRYLGYRKSHEENDLEVINKEVDQCIVELNKVLDPKSFYKRLPIVHNEDGSIDIEGIHVTYKSLLKNLEGCDECFMMCATAGIGIDRMIKRAELTSMTKATIYQAIGAEMVECVCDELNEQLRREVEKEGFYLKPRFSPGYGDVPLLVQKDFERILNMSKHCGINLNETLLMVPSKSVTAFIGITKTKTKVHSSCESCDKLDCPSRRV